MRNPKPTELTAVGSVRPAVRQGWWLLLLVVLAAGAWLRVQQFPDQVLLDDEWHAVHQLLADKGPAELFLTFGTADYSIPLGLLYWLEMRGFGLSELAMRWPMLLASLATLGLFSAFARRRFAPPVAVLFAGLLALSPMLIVYGYTARPYALTLLLAYLAHYAFYRYWRSERPGPAWAAAFSAAAALCIWLHPVTGPFVVAPFLLEAARAALSSDGQTLKRLLWLALPSGALTAALVLPPLLADAGALGDKAGIGDLAPETLSGVWFMWLGTPSLFCVAMLLLFAAVGFRDVAAATPLAGSAAVGVLLTALALLVSEPAWVQHPLTLGRYLLPALPLLLLAAAAGAVKLWRAIGQTHKRLGNLFAIFVVALLLLYAVESPVWPLVRAPNSHITHLHLQFDFREPHNRISDYQAAIPLSPFWQAMGERARGSLRVAVAPFYFESYNWDAVRWEAVSGQRIVPAFLTGFCVDRRFGETPDDERFRWRNVYYLESLEDAGATRPDWLVYTRPFRGFEHGKEDQSVGARVAQCADQLRDLLGEPDYADEFLVAYDLKGRE
ncbi:MAG: glycosyltransferase family 39 protein [Xanthomonadales bacterium]|nr:glycosyltransferase family 39 protein [Xanthomonadales bacterium]